MKKIFLSLFVVILFGGHCFAASSASEKLPVEIMSDSLEILQIENKAIFKGSVHAVRGDASMRSQEMHVYYDAHKNKIGESESSVSKVEAIKNVSLKTNEEKVTGDLGLFDVNKNEITISGNVILTRGKNVVKGTKLIYNLNTKQSQMVGATAASGKKQRVKGVFVPEK